MTTKSTHLRTIVNQDGAVILDKKLGKLSTLNPTGAYVWQALERGEALEIIVADLARKTGEELDTVEREVREFIKSLREQQLLSC